jgi:hypothetical protein
MYPSTTVIEMSSDGGITWPISLVKGMPVGLDGHQIQLPRTDQPTTHFRLQLRGSALWFAIRDVGFLQGSLICSNLELLPISLHFQ